MVSGKLLGDVSMDSGLGLIRERAQSGNNTVESGGGDSRQRNTDAMALKSLLTHCGATSVLQLRWVFPLAVWKNFTLFSLQESIV